jgi:formylglycine-generating enzyme required for sulfatase activity
VSSFRLDKYDVTVGRFRQFVAAWNGGWLPAEGSGKHTYLNGGQGLVDVGAPPDAGTVYEPGWDATDWNNPTDVDPTNANLVSCTFDSSWTNTVSTQERLPINCVNWYEAYAFCIWDGGFLPSESEWEYAAAGGSQEREYPWGATAPGTASEYAIYGCYYPLGFGSCMAGTNMAPVGTPTAGAGLWGQLDLAGNVWQWNLDQYEPYVDPCADCAYLTGAPGRMAGGGSNGLGAADLRASLRFPQPPATRGPGLGLRCARVP